MQYYSGILRDKTMDYKLIYNPNDYKQYSPFGGLKVMVDKFGQCKFEITNQDLIKLMF